MICTSPISCNIVSAEKLHVGPVATGKGTGLTGMPIGARALGYGQAMWGKSTLMSNNY